MQNYYTILGIANFASQIEVKNAFRRMAKLYHPDVNATGQEQFKLIAKAYEVLSDPYKKSQYDYRLKYFLNSGTQKTTSAQQPKTKTYDFTEQELKRRQYYQEHYKKQYEQSQTAQTTSRKSNYNEFKNILVATPLAVLLIMILLNVWSTKPSIVVVPYKEEVKKAALVEERKRITTGDTPYQVYFGGAVEDTLAKRSLLFKNMSGRDVIVFLFSKKEFLRTCYVEHGYEVSLEMLPREIGKMRIMQGKNFEYVKELPKAGVYGAFTVNCKFYEYNKKLKLNGSNQFTLAGILDQGFVEVTEDNFFKKNL